MSLLRLKNDIKDLQKQNEDFFYFEFDQENQMFQGYIIGPENSPYQGYTYQIQIKIDSEYPIKAPKVFFKTKIFHPNVHFDSGEVCMEILKQEWNPSIRIQRVIEALFSLLLQPNIDSPLNVDAGKIISIFSQKK